MFISKKKYEKLLQDMEGRADEKLRTIAGGLEEGGRRLEEIDQNM